MFSESAYEKTLSKDEVTAARQRAAAFQVKSRKYIPSGHPRIKIHPAADKVDLTHNLMISRQIVDTLDDKIILRKHIKDQKGMSNPELLFNGKHLGDIKTPEGYDLTETFKGARRQMGNKIVNPQQIQYVIVLELNKIPDITNAQLSREIGRRITDKRGKIVLKMIILQETSVFEITREDIIIRRLFNILKSKRPE